MILSREAILAASDLKTETVAVPEWGGDVLVGVMTGEARDAWEQSLVVREGSRTKANMQNVRARLVAATVVDEEGKRLFSDADAEALGAKSAAALDRVCKVAQRLNGMTDADLEEAKGN
jgi:hypothetical protein